MYNWRYSITWSIDPAIFNLVKKKEKQKKHRTHSHVENQNVNQKNVEMFLLKIPHLWGLENFLIISLPNPTLEIPYMDSV
jgi:hypothetical protein